MTPQDGGFTQPFGAGNGDKRLGRHLVQAAHQDLCQRGGDGDGDGDDGQDQPLQRRRVNHRDQPQLKRKKLDQGNPQPERR